MIELALTIDKNIIIIIVKTNDRPIKVPIKHKKQLNPAKYPL